MSRGGRRGALGGGGSSRGRRGRRPGRAACRGRCHRAQAGLHGQQGLGRGQLGVEALLCGSERRLIAGYRGKFAGGRALATRASRAAGATGAARPARAAGVARDVGRGRRLAGLIGGEADGRRGDRGLGGADLGGKRGGGQVGEGLPGRDVRAEADPDRSHLPGDREADVGLADRLDRPGRQQGLGDVRPGDGGRAVRRPGRAGYRPRGSAAASGGDHDDRDDGPSPGVAAEPGLRHCWSASPRRPGRRRW